MMANIVIIPMTGWFQRRFGFRRYFAASIFIFTAASALCGLAWSLPSLVAFRVLQGLGGGAIIPTAQSILFARYPKAQHGMASALFGLGAVTGPLLGPTIGGYLIDWSNWHWVFLVNIPLGLVAAVAALRVIEEPGFAPAREPVDVVGIALLATGMPSLQYVLEEGNRDGWFEDWRIAVLAAVAVVTLLTFVVHELESHRARADARDVGQRRLADVHARRSRRGRDGDEGEPRGDGAELRAGLSLRRVRDAPRRDPRLASQASEECCCRQWSSLTFIIRTQLLANLSRARASVAASVFVNR
jgi:DHA2 family multidrug resistance protein